jgi:proteasome lid subunit RPN8/RPN11
VVRVEIRKKAFFPLILAAAETFKKETSGLILGRYENGRVVVKTSVPCQESKRSFGYFDFNKKRLRVMQEIIEEFYPKTNYDLLGYFHSHPEYGKIKFKPKPSRADKKWIFDEEDEGIFFLFIAIREKTKKQKWHLRKAGKILCGIIGRFRFDISVYFRKRKRLFRTKIVFPQFLK